MTSFVRSSVLGLVVAMGLGCSRPKEQVKPDPVVVQPKSDLSTKVALRATWAAHFDARKMRATAAVETWRVALAVPPLSELVARVSAKCPAMVDTLEEVVASGRESKWMVVAHLGVPLDRALSCVRDVEGAKSVTFHARPALEFHYGEWVALAIDDVLLVGDRTLAGELVELAYGPAAQPPEGPGFVLEADQILALRLQATGMVRAVEASLVAVPKDRKESLTFTAKVFTFDDHAARTVIAEVDPLGDKATASKLVQVTLSAASGTSAAEVRVSSLEDVTTAARMTAAVMIGLGSAVLRLDKTTAARATVEGLARRLAAIVSEPTSGHRLPPATGPLPSFVPTAVLAHIPAPAGPWRPFSGLIPRDTFYQYEVETTPDGKHAIVHARGDLDGDGMQSHFAVPVDVNPSGYAVMGGLTISDPLE